MSSVQHETEWVLRNARLVGRPDGLDIAIANGRIAAVESALAMEGEQEFDLEGRLVLPGFVDAHLHMDKVYALEDEPAPADSLDAAIVAYLNWRRDLDPDRLYRNARRVAERALLNGTIALRTHVSVDSIVGYTPLEILVRLREEFSSRMEIQIVAFPDSHEVDTGGAEPLLREALAIGADLIGGAPDKSSDPRQMVDTILDLAAEEGCDVDLHVDESDNPSSNSLEYLAERKMVMDFPGTVVAGHCCALSALDEDAARRVIGKVAEAGIQVITLPSCNLYLMGRSDRGLVRRGLTRVRELADAGVNIAFASDNIRDHFNPFGNADMLLEMLITGLALQMGTPDEMEELMNMGTYNPARILGLFDYGLQPGDTASLVVLDASDFFSAVAAIAPRRYVFARGQLVAQTTVETELL